MKNIFIVSAKRTAIGGFMGALKQHTAPQLGAAVIQAAYQSISVEPDTIGSVYIGNVLSANLGQSPARQAAILAGLAYSSDCTTVNKVCSSGLKAIMIGAGEVESGREELVMTGGMESMSNTPHYLMQRSGNKLGNEFVTDGILRDGLTDGLESFHMGKAAERCARQYGISRGLQDEYALRSYERAGQATQNGKFREEIVSVTVQQQKGEITFSEDEDIYKIKPARLSTLPPVFETNGTITAANASNLNDGAAAILLASGESIKKFQLKPLARIVSYADAARPPAEFATAPSLAIPKALQQAGLSLRDIDYVELNEAYAAVVLANQQLLELDDRSLNVYGGAVAMGHPLGASGARILCTLLSVLRQEGGRYGVAAICNGGGGASAMVIENLM